MIAVGLCKGVYDANIFASVYDVVPAKMRGTTAGLMNTIGWAFASLGPWTIGRASDRYGLSAAIGSISVVYVSGACSVVAASLAARGKPPPGDPSRARPTPRRLAARSRCEKEPSRVDHFPRVATAPIPSGRAGDINAFFGLMLDNISDMILMASLLVGVFGFPADSC